MHHKLYTFLKQRSVSHEVFDHFEAPLRNIQHPDPQDQDISPSFYNHPGFI